jgi:hypothetical protein
LCTQYIVRSFKEQERKENVHFALKLHHKMLNPKVKSHKEQARKESLDALTSATLFIIMEKSYLELHLRRNHYMLFLPLPN